MVEKRSIRFKKKFSDCTNRKYFIILLAFTLLFTSIQVVEAGVPKIIEYKVTNPINENDNQLLEVWVKNIGTSDNVGVTLYALDGTLLYSRSEIVNAEDTYKFEFIIPVNGVSSDTNVKFKIEAKAWNGDDYAFVEYTVKNITPTSTPKESPNFGIILSLIAIFVTMLFKKFKDLEKD